MGLIKIHIFQNQIISEDSCSICKPKIVYRIHQPHRDGPSVLSSLAKGDDLLLSAREVEMLFMQPMLTQTAAAAFPTPLPPTATLILSETPNPQPTEARRLKRRIYRL